ncbi:MAG: hypothetical protein KAS72_10100 [Phycisphaerales bacterium]|nr:hypothetical protein [Phycisphaerales bacterium]
MGYRGRITTWAALAAVVICAPMLGADDTDREAELRAWIQARLSGDVFPTSSKEGIVVEYTLEHTTTLSSAEIERRWKKVERYPDHPDRTAIQRHRRLLSTPERLRKVLQFADSGAWLLEERYETGNMSGSSFRAGGVEDIRWMVSESGGDSTSESHGQLTMIRAGVPFPAGYNISRFLDMQREQLGLLLYGSLPRLLPGGSIESLQVDESSWTVMVSWEGSDRAAEVRGRWDRDTGQPIVRVLRRFAADRSKYPRPAEIRYEDYVFDGLLGQSHATSVVEDHFDEFRDAYLIQGLRVVSREKVVNAASPPTVGEQVRIADFREARSSELAINAESPHMTWHRSNRIDTYDISELLVATPRLAGSTSDSGESPSSSRRLLAIVATIIIILTVPLIVYRLRRTQ